MEPSELAFLSPAKPHAAAPLSRAQPGLASSATRLYSAELRNDWLPSAGPSAFAFAASCMLVWQRQSRRSARRCAQGASKVRCRSTAQDAVDGTLVYQDQGVERSLKFAGVGSVNGELVESKDVRIKVPVSNGRGKPFTLDEHGFELVDDAPEVVDFYNEMDICKKYYPACCELVKKVTGAKEVYAFYHTVRSHESVPEARKRSSKGFPVENPASSVHNDYSLACAERQVRMLSKAPQFWPDPRPLLGLQPLIPASQADEYLRDGKSGKKRWAIVNVWRNLSEEPVQRDPLCFCDGTSFELNDLVTFQSKKGRLTKEYYFSAPSESHDWYYFPDVKRDEAIILKTWDSKGKQFASEGREDTVPSTFSLHTAFSMPNTNAKPHRQSMEVRTVVFY
eukprot:TRINITY_DN44655_c0_g1_i1.p1 TRINITY_DN44655_c0_g1~~TRINITY_DN44655_c0_g1_i1.p1  ORF type:complete len:408 (-),score=73.95 TRINITY_DN44655_c0_g1_i1:245-1426(-)